MSVYEESRMTTGSPEFNVSYDVAVATNDRFREDITTILWNFYDEFHSESNYLLIILYVPVMVIAVTANVLVIAVVFKYHYMRSVTNYFVVNLSVADLLVTTICMPVAVSQAISIVWDHGEIMCKLSSYLQGVAVAASVFTITAMSIDRYLAIRNPIVFRRVFKGKSTVPVIVGLWMVALIIFAPVLRVMTLYNPATEVSNITFHGSWAKMGNFSQNTSHVSRLPPAFYICSPSGRSDIRAHLFGVVCFVLVYAIPGFVVVLSYSMMGRTLCSRRPPFDCDSVGGSASSQQSFRLVRERRRIAWILMLLAVLFALCWLPYNVLMLLIDLGAVGEGTIITNCVSYCLFLGHANSALNPVVYCFMTRKFRRSVSEILCRGSHGLARRNPRRRSVQGTAVIDDVCAGCSTGGGSLRRGLLRKREMLSGCDCGLPIGGNHAVMALRRTATLSSGYDSFYSRHSPHRRCYMLKSLRRGTQTVVDQPSSTSKNRMESEHGVDRQHTSTQLTMDEPRS
ncbi:orexin/Hypocretin receptor type 1-like [Calliopsis andreniformis]|uniref:orexin/Hypocretin receptor type 1-like n=1 Tax=Calliopsis andreniformis TaxID=337506 RepID=UPI003FCD434C